MEKVYNRRIPESSNLYRIFYQYYDQYEIQYPILYEKEYGYFRKAISKAVCKYLDCGILVNGMARVRCPKCFQNFFIAFSCKAINICPSCSQKRTLLLSDWILNNVLENLPNRQWVFTLPKNIKKTVLQGPQTAQMARCASDTIMELYRALHQEAKPAIVLSIQTFGDLLLWHRLF